MRFLILIFVLLGFASTTLAGPTSTKAPVHKFFYVEEQKNVDASMSENIYLINLTNTP